MAGATLLHPLHFFFSEHRPGCEHIGKCSEVTLTRRSKGGKDKFGGLQGLQSSQLFDPVKHCCFALEPRGRGLLGMTLRYPYEVRDEPLR